MGMALLRRHEMGDYLQRMYLKPYDHAGASGTARWPDCIRPEPPATVAGSPTGDGSAACLEGASNAHRVAQHTVPHRAA